MGMDWRWRGPGTGVTYQGLDGEGVGRGRDRGEGKDWRRGARGWEEQGVGGSGFGLGAARRMQQGARCPGSSRGPARHIQPRVELRLKSRDSLLLGSTQEGRLRLSLRLRPRCCPSHRERRGDRAEERRGERPMSARFVGRTGKGAQDGGGRRGTVWRRAVGSVAAHGGRWWTTWCGRGGGGGTVLLLVWN